MAQRANIVLPNGRPTPVNQTFVPTAGDGNVPGVSVIGFENRQSGIQVGFDRISVSTRLPSGKTRNTKIGIVVTVPVLENVSNSTVTGIAPAPTKAYDCVFRGEFILPERSDLIARADLLAYVKNLMADAVITNMIKNLESMW